MAFLWVASRLNHGVCQAELARRRAAGITESWPSPRLLLPEGGERVILRFCAIPVIHGCGHRYWGPLKEQRTLKLLSLRALSREELVLDSETVPKLTGKRRNRHAP